MILIKANKELLDGFHVVARSITDLGGIVQNDTELTVEQIEDWAIRMMSAAIDLEQLVILAVDHLIACGAGDQSFQSHHKKAVPNA